MKSKGMRELMNLLTAGVLLLSIGLIGEASGDGKDQVQAQDQLRLKDGSCQDITEVGGEVVASEACGCSCQFCQNCICPLCKNCVCPGCEDVTVAGPEGVQLQDQLQLKDGSCQDVTVVTLEGEGDQDQLQIQDRLWLRDGSCLDITDEGLDVAGSDTCDCLCQCCRDCICTCSKNCLCACCRDEFCTSRRNRLRICADESFRAQLQNQFQNSAERQFEVQAMFAESEGEDFGNCLSYPVIWADASMTVRGQYGIPVFNGLFTEELPGGPWYLQQDEYNMWQAQNVEWLSGAHGDLVLNDIVWGDNLARDWTLHSVVRVETVLYKDISEVCVDCIPAMQEFEMAYLFGEGPDEMQGTNGVTSDSILPTVYTPKAWLTIQRWSPGSDELTWNADTRLWQGAEAPVVSGGYSAEINVKGKVVFGYNWFVRNTATETGRYRLTMYLLEGSEAAIESGLTYVDVDILRSVAGGSDGGDGGDGGGSSLVADFEAGPLTTGDAPLKVYFEDMSTGGPNSWLWQFGDDNTSTQENPVHTYLLPGSYTVRLTVAKGKGGKTDTETKWNYITVN